MTPRRLHLRGLLPPGTGNFTAILHTYSGPTHRLTVLSTYNNDRYRPGLNTFCWRTLQLLPDQPLHD